MFCLRYLALTILITAISLAETCAQDVSIDSIYQKAALYSISQSSTTLFVHFDKTVYTSNENIWFTGYLFKTAQTAPLYQTLSVALVSDATREVHKEVQFVVNSGICFGDMRLPDSLPVGNYRLLAYTNRLSKNAPEDIFTQQIVIRKAADPSFKASLQLLPPAADGSYQVKAEGFDSEGRLLSNATLEYSLGTMAGGLTGKAKTNVKGEYVFTIPTAQVNPADPLFRARISRGNETVNLQVKLPVKSDPVIRFFPEGGSLVESLSSLVGWEARDGSGVPMQISGTLLRDGVPVDTIRTSVSGIGRFMLRPQKGSTYTLKLLGNEVNFPLASLPKPLKQGAVLHIAQAAAQDTLTAMIYTTKPGVYTILIHTYSEIYSIIERQADPNMVLKIPLDDVPKGLATITVLDSLGRPCAERLFFSNYRPESDIAITTSKREYAMREKVEVSIKLNQSSSTNLKAAIVSVACVQENRINAVYKNDADTYLYLKHELAPFSADFTGKGYRNQAFVEDLLLTKGWRKYNWNDLMATNPADTVIQARSLQFTGNVLRYDKPLKKPVSVMMVNGGFKEIITDNTGNFKVADSALISPPGRKPLIAVDTPDKHGYTVQVSNPYTNIAKTVADHLVTSIYEPAIIIANSRDMAIARNERMITMKEVKVSARKGSVYDEYGVNECGDYVCLFNILNCGNHPFGKIPVKGQEYISNGTRTVYSGCENKPSMLAAVNGIYYAKEFYGSDFSQVNLPIPEYASTLFWNHLSRITATDAAKFSFYTTDITGKFKIIVQGVADNGVVYGEQDFEVKAAK